MRAMVGTALLLLAVAMPAEASSGWYLIDQQTRQQLEAFDSAKECEVRLQQRRANQLRIKLAERGPRSGSAVLDQVMMREICIASDDPRLGGRP